MKVLLDQQYVTHTPKPFARDDALAISVHKWQQRGRSNFFDLGCRLLSGMCGIQRVSNHSLDYLKIWDILFAEKERFLQIKQPFYSIHADAGMNTTDYSSATKEFLYQTTGMYQGISDELSDRNILLSTVTGFGAITDLWSQSEDSLLPLGEGGTFILQVGELYHRQTQLLLWVMFQSFEQVSVVKPPPSNAFDNEKYIVCHHFKRTVYSHSYTARMKESAELFEGCPLSWFSYISHIEDQFRKEKEIAQRKAEIITSLLVLHHPQLSGKSLEVFEQDLTSGKNIEKYCARYLESVNHRYPHPQALRGGGFQ